MIARLEVTRGTLTEYPLAEKVRDGWQNGVTFYPDAEVTKVTPLHVATAEPQGEPSSEAWRNNLSYAATALEASADNGDRYCARLIREHLAERVTVEPQGEPSSIPFYDEKMRELAEVGAQGEPSDAQVMAASVVLDGQIAFDLLRAALRAASSVTKGENL